MFNKFSPLLQKIAVDSFSELRPVKIVNVALPPPYIVKQYDARDMVKWDGFFQPNHTVTYFQLDVVNNNKERRYYGQHYHADNTVYIQDIFNKRNYEFRDNEYQNLADYHNGKFSLYHKMLVEFYVQP